MKCCCCLRNKRRMTYLPHELVESILERVPVKSLGRFKSVSKCWKSTMESRFFKERQMSHHRQQSGGGDPHVLMVCTEPPNMKQVLKTLVLGSDSPVNIPTPWEGNEDSNYYVCSDSCDGLVCLYHIWEPGFVINPTARWSRPLPLCGLQQLIIDLGESHYDPAQNYSLFKPGFGKDVFTGTYKAVWLYNSSEYGLDDNATTCEVFDFTSTSSWRYVDNVIPYRIVGFSHPAYVDGSLHWFTECKETKILSFDLHTEAFRVFSKALPFANSDSRQIVMCNLENRLCVSEKKWPNQVIWSFNQGNKTWDKICSIDVEMTSLLCDISTRHAFHPLALLNGENNNKKKKLLFYCPVDSRSLLTTDPVTKTEENVAYCYRAKSVGYVVCYFPSLFSI